MSKSNTIIDALNQIEISAEALRAAAVHTDNNALSTLILEHAPRVIALAACLRAIERTFEIEREAAKIGGQQ